MPMGLTYAPSSFTLLMRTVLKDEIEDGIAAVYFDDVAIKSKGGPGNHWSAVEAVCKRLQENKLVINVNKCKFGYKRVIYLGHLIGENLIMPDPSKLEVVAKMKKPRDALELRRMLGLFGYWRKFVNKHAKIIMPLTQLLGNSMKHPTNSLEWKRIHEQAFNEIKTLLVSQPVLAIIDTSVERVDISTDASNDCVGAVLEQNGHPVGYISRGLKQSELGHSTYAKECLAINYALKSFLPFLYMKKVRIYTDHKPLVDIETATPSPIINRTRELIQAVSGEVQIIYREGAKNVAADCLSRLHHERNDGPGIIEENETYSLPVDMYTAAVTTRRQLKGGNTSVKDMKTNVKKKQVKSKTQGKRSYNSREDELDKFVEEDTVLVRPNKKESLGAQSKPKKPDIRVYPSDRIPDLSSSTRVTKSTKSKKKVDDLSVDTLDSEGSGTMVAPHTPTFPTLTEETKREIIDGYGQDTKFMEIYEYLSKDKPRPVQGRLRVALDYYFVKDGLLFRKDPMRNGDHRLCVPQIEFRDTLVEQVHCSDVSHLGRDRTIDYVSSRFYWPNLQKDVSEFVKSCERCLKSKPQFGKKEGVLMPIPVASKPFVELTMDFFSGLPESGGFDRVWVIVDRFTKMVRLLPCTTTMIAEMAADIFIDNVYCHWGLPDSIISDNDTLFSSRFWKQLFDRLKVKLKFTTVGHPQSDGLSERMIGTVRSMLRTMIDSDATPWHRILPLIEFSLNNTKSVATGYAPFYLCYLHHPRSVVDWVTGVRDDASNSLENRLMAAKRIHSEAVMSMQDNNAVYAGYYDTKRKPAQVYEPGDLVLVNRSVMSSVWEKQLHSAPKMRKPFIGPFKVVEQLSPVTYKLAIPKGFHSKDVVNVMHLKRFVPNGEFEPAPLMEDYSGRWYIPDSINDMRTTVSGKREYKVRWQGFEAFQDTWQTEEDLATRKDLIDQFHAARGSHRN